MIVIIIIDVVVELKTQRDYILCVRCQADISIRVKVHVQIFYQQYKLFVTICSQQNEKNNVFVVIFNVLFYINVTTLLCIFHKNHVKKNR